MARIGGAAFFLFCVWVFSTGCSGDVNPAYVVPVDTDADADADADTDVDTDVDADADGDTETEVLSCGDALMCLVGGGGDVLSCLTGADEEAQTLMWDLAACLGTAGCFWADDMMSCALESCPDETLACVADS